MRWQPSCDGLSVRPGNVPTTAILSTDDVSAWRVRTVNGTTRQLTVTNVTAWQLIIEVFDIEQVYAVPDRTLTVRPTTLDGIRRSSEGSHEPIDCSALLLGLDEGLDFDDTLDSVTGGRNICDRGRVLNREDFRQEAVRISVQLGRHWSQAGSPPSGHDS
ncbi:hypothetical protein ACN27F_31705 [Solwaraspora sp. WMMB335]|uniref:hypothetical protein n=1 Tax=Solwaraspora sp. WMMB335 TaxID=3404118 RepID=UPI003B957616